MKQEQWISIIVILAFLSSTTGFILIPEHIIDTHWNVNGEADGTMTKFWGLFLLPLIMIITSLFLIYLPKLDPLKKNVKSFSSQYHNFVILIMLYLLLTHLFTIFWNLGYRMPMNYFIMILTGILFLWIGNFLPHTKRNWFIGIRTPWTLSDDYVWEKTHDAGSRGFIALGLIIILTIFLPDYMGVWILLSSLFALVFFLFGYSYYLFINKPKK